VRVVVKSAEMIKIHHVNGIKLAQYIPE